MGSPAENMAEAAFESFDWEDERWVSYLGQVTIPADRPYESTVQRLKRKWFKKNIDESLEFDATSSSGTPSEPPPSEPAAASGSAAPPPTQPTAQPEAKPTSLKEFVLRRKTIHYLMSIWLLFNAVVYGLPFSDAATSSTAYHRACNAAFLKAFAELFRVHGAPSPTGIWYTIKGVMNKEYASAMKMQKIVNDKNMHNSFVYFMFNAAPSIPFAILPIALTSIYTVADYSNGLFELVLPPLHRLLASPLDKILSKGKKITEGPEKGTIPIFLWIAWLEVAILTVLFLQLFTPQRSFMLVLIYAQFLLIRHTSNGAPGLHTQKVISTLDSKISILTRKVGPVDTLYCKLKGALSGLVKRSQ